jgi:hypothetical protein
MKKNLLICFIFISSISLAQPSKMESNRDPYKWIFGASWNVIDDNGYPFTKLFDMPGSWNYHYLPTRITAEKYLYNHWSWEIAAAYNKYFSSKLINQETGHSGFNVNADFNLKYSFNSAKMKNRKRFDPYFSMGLGGTFRTSLEVPVNANFNLNIGTNYWLTHRWGLQIQTSGKVSLFPEILFTNANYMQHSFGVIYKHDPRGLKSKSNFDKKKYPWTREKQRFKRRST